MAQKSNYFDMTFSFVNDIEILYVKTRMLLEDVHTKMILVEMPILI